MSSQLMDSIKKTLLLGLTSFGFGCVVYLLISKEDRETEVKIGPVYTAKSVTVEIRVPRLSVGNIVGRNGSKIKGIEKETHTRMFFRDLNDTADVKLCVIRGIAEGVEIAQKFVYDSILTYPEVDTVEIFVPLRICCLLVLRFGESINWAQRLTRTEIIMDNWSFHNNYSTRKVYIKGSDHQIERAKSFFAQKIEEDDEKPPVTPSGPLPAPSRRVVANDDDSEDDLILSMEEVFKTGNNGLLEVYVASIESPEKFWVQIMGQGILALDKLAEEMTDFYEKSTNRRTHKLKEVKVGMIIAIPYQYDTRWYRGEVKSIYVDKTNDKETILEVFYLDFGDIGSYRKREAFELDEKFKSMRYQAIECKIANIKSRDIWPNEAIDLFKKITCSGIWNTMSAKIIEYKCSRKCKDKKNLPVPCLQLIDTSHPIYLDVAYELVREGFAEWIDDFNPE